MGKLYLVRHAQASFGFGDYDKLSDFGKKQTAFIPKHFTDKYDALYSGDMVRHRETVEGAFGAVQQQLITGFNEFDHIGVLKVHIPEIMEPEKVMAIVSVQPDPMKFMEQQFEQAMLKWMNEEGPSVYAEPYAGFKQRCIEALNTVVEAARANKHDEVVVVTSGGVISLLMGYITGLTDPQTIPLNTSIANGSVTMFNFNNEKISLGYFNNYSHLPKEMVTFI
ncbi:MAG TPA: histidine phosphatase family protein [Chitinophagales bacterium]|nr:histidine phosphatase family protein [Chitinophagales bacterium]